MNSSMGVEKARTAMIATPYVSDDMAEIWYAVSDVTLPAARHLAAEFAREVGDEWSRSRFVGKVIVPLHDHEADMIGEGCCDAQPIPAWHFTIYEQGNG